MADFMKGLLAFLAQLTKLTAQLLSTVADKRIDSFLVAAIIVAHIFYCQQRSHRDFWQQFSHRLRFIAKQGTELQSGL